MNTVMKKENTALDYLGYDLYAFGRIILISFKIASFFVNIHPDGYKDMTLSFSIYDIVLRLEVKKQNKD